MVTGIRDGQPYYVAVGGALRERNYATREVFNWRTPLHMMALARLGDMSRPLLIALAVAVCLGTVAFIIHEPQTVRWTAMLAQAGVLALLANPAAVYLSEAWAGVLMALSVIAYGRRRAVIALPLGLSALFVRELAAPYCVVCTLIAAYHRRWRELLAWTTGALLYGGYYAHHLLQVWKHRLPTDLAHPSSWLELGGLPSLTGKIHFQFWLLLAPYPLTVIALVLVVAACCDFRVPQHLRLTTATYIGFFLFAGKTFDTYWGLLTWPTWSLACGFGMQYLRDAGCNLRPARCNLRPTSSCSS